MLISAIRLIAGISRRALPCRITFLDKCFERRPDGVRMFAIVLAAWP